MAVSSVWVDCWLDKAQSFVFDCYQHSIRLVGYLLLAGSARYWRGKALEVGCRRAWALERHKRVGVERVPMVASAGERSARFLSTTSCRGSHKKLDLKPACDLMTILTILTCSSSSTLRHRNYRNSIKEATRRSPRFEFCFSVVASFSILLCDTLRICDFSSGRLPKCFFRFPTLASVCLPIRRLLIDYKNKISVSFYRNTFNFLPQPTLHTF